MLRQEINLYQPAEASSASSAFFSWKFLCLSNAFFFCLFSVIYLLSIWEIHRLKAQSIAAQHQVLELKDKFNKVKNSYPDIFFSHDVTKSVGELQQRMAAQKQIMETLKNHIAFSEGLIALSRVTVPDVWLTGINMTESGDNISLKGNSNGIENLRTFFNNLSNDKFFLKSSLSIKNIENKGTNENNGLLIFEINIVKNNNE